MIFAAFYADLDEIWSEFAKRFAEEVKSLKANFKISEILILAALLLFVFSVLREEFASMFQTFSRSDPPGKAPLTRGRYVFQKKKKKKKKNLFLGFNLLFVALKRPDLFEFFG